MTTTSATTAHLERNLWLVQSGRRSRAAGIRRCPDCAAPFIDDHKGLSWCRDCRGNHSRHCQCCGTSFLNTVDGDDRCASCRAQDSLFDIVPISQSGGGGDR